MDWIWNAATALIALGALAVAIWAAVQARHANTLVGVYQRALWTVDMAAEQEGWMLLSLTNKGESPARDVRLRLDSDPFHTLTEDISIPFVAKGSDAQFRIRIPEYRVPDHASGAMAAWSSWYRWFERDELRQARISWTDLENHEVEQTFLLPLSSSRPLD